MRDSSFVKCVLKEFGEKIVEILGTAVVEVGGDGRLVSGGVVVTAVVGDRTGCAAIA